jgi:hypothetical protein
VAPPPPELRSHHQSDNSSEVNNDMIKIWFIVNLKVFCSFLDCSLSLIWRASWFIPCMSYCLDDDLLQGMHLFGGSKIAKETNLICMKHITTIFIELVLATAFDLSSTSWKTINCCFPK